MVNIFFIILNDKITLLINYIILTDFRIAHEHQRKEFFYFFTREKKEKIEIYKIKK